MMNHSLSHSAAAVFATAVVTVGAYLAVRKYQESHKPKSLFERIGGEAAVSAVVGKFYERMLADPRVARFFKDTNMAKQHAKQTSFISYVLGSPKKYAGLAMDTAHRRLVKEQGMSDEHFDATKENLYITLTEVGVPKELRDEVATLFESLREQVLCRGKWAIEETKPAEKTLFERIGGEKAVDAVVGIFYDRMLADPVVSRFFKDTNMAKQHAKQTSFISYVLGSPKKYAGLAMDVAHRKLVRDQGLNDEHFTRTKFILYGTLVDAGVPKDLCDEVATLFESLREQVLCRGQWSIEPKKPSTDTRSLFDRIGGEKAVEAVVGKFYDRMLSDSRVSRFFKDTNMAKQHAKQVSFISYVLGSPKKYAGLAMDTAHRRLVKEQGMDDTHFDATKENLYITLTEAGVPKELRDEVADLFESLREQVLCRGKWAIAK